MKHFTELFLTLDGTTKTNAKVAALVHYFSQASDQGKLWAIALLSGKRPKRTVNTRLLREWSAELCGLPDWLFEESYHVVGDLAEAIALLLPEPTHPTPKPLAEWMALLNSLKEASEAQKKATILTAWAQLTRSEKFVFNKLITGGFRMGVSQKLMVRALAQYTNQPENVLAHRLMGNWEVASTSFEALVLSPEDNENQSRPYPFYLAYPLEEAPEALGTPEDWMAERKWDGIRGQLIVRQGELYVWSRGEELVTDKYPEYEALRSALPHGTVIDGEILAHNGTQPLPFNLLQTRIGRKTISKKSLKEAPVILMAYDLLEADGLDLRQQPLATRRARLEQLVLQANTPVLKLSPLVPFSQWGALATERENARQHLTEGLMLKRRSSTYQVGRKRGDWWKWKADPFTIDAVLIYAMRGHGRRANLYTDYTFAVWDGGALVPFTKAYSGLTDKELQQVDAYVKKNTIERFGPVRSVTPQLVMEIAFEGIAKSPRHKSGVALRFPRINRWRHDKPTEEANTLADLMALLEI